MGIIKKVVERRKQFLAKHKKEATLFANKIARILGEKFKAEKVILYGSLVLKVWVIIFFLLMVIAWD